MVYLNYGVLRIGFFFFQTKSMITGIPYLNVMRIVISLASTTISPSSFLESMYEGSIDEMFAMQHNSASIPLRCSHKRIYVSDR